MRLKPELFEVSLLHSITEPLTQRQGGRTLISLFASFEADRQVRGRNLLSAVNRTYERSSSATAPRTVNTIRPAGVAVSRDSDI